MFLLSRSSDSIMLDFCTVMAGAGRGTGSIGETAVPGGMALGRRSWGSTEAAHPSTDPDSLEKQQPIILLSASSVIAHLEPYSARRLELSHYDRCIPWGSRVVVPLPGREAVLRELHEGHPGSLG